MVYTRLFLSKWAGTVITASKMFFPNLSLAVLLNSFKTNAEISSGSNNTDFVLFFDGILILICAFPLSFMILNGHFLLKGQPMKRLTSYMVLATFCTIRCLALEPMVIPSLVIVTHDGVKVSLWSFLMISIWPFREMATHEYVVSRSIPTAGCLEWNNRNWNSVPIDDFKDRSYQLLTQRNDGSYVSYALLTKEELRRTHG